jgi:hypothetical protein
MLKTIMLLSLTNKTIMLNVPMLSVVIPNVVVLSVVVPAHGRGFESRRCRRHRQEKWHKIVLQLGVQ